MKKRVLTVFLLMTCSVALNVVHAARESTDSDTVHVQRGTASHYSSRFHGKRTANGERYDRNALTAAHRTLPLSSFARITNLRNNRSVVVRVNDRGAFRGKHVVDLSHAAAEELGINGLGTVEITPM